MSQIKTEEYACGMYERVNKMWLDHKAEIFCGACGFSVLGNPPIFKPKWMFIGANPGFGGSDDRPHTPTKWPTTEEAKDAKWPLANKLRSICDNSNFLIDLNTTQQTNFQFFKSTTIKKASPYRWNDLPNSLRVRLESFCRSELCNYIKIVRPDAILVLGIETFDKHATKIVSVLQDRSGRRRLLVEGEVFGIPARGILHPSGAQVANDDWLRVVDHITKNPLST